MYILFSGGVVPRDTSVQVLVITVGDNKPEFNQNTYKGTIEEGRDPGTIIVKVKNYDLFFSHAG